MENGSTFTSKALLLLFSLLVAASLKLYAFYPLPYPKAPFHFVDERRKRGDGFLSVTGSQFREQRAPRAGESLSNRILSGTGLDV